MYRKLTQALDEISEKHVAEAANDRKRHRRAWLGAIAAVLALVLLLNVPNIPMIVTAKAVSTASESRALPRPGSSASNETWDAWRADRDQREAAVAEAIPQLKAFFEESTALYMAGAEGNRVWSPINGYIALAMLAEVTDGNSRQQVLSALNTPDLETLRAQVGALWESVYRDDGNEICTLANSLWLDKGLSYDQEAMDNLAYYHYASVYQADLGSHNSASALRAWLSNNTGGLLKDRTGTASFPENAVLTLASTVYLQARWSEEFKASKNTQGLFHAPGGDVTVTYMNQKDDNNYYWGESFGAVGLGLKNGTKMWFFLPDEDKTLDDVLSEGEYMDVVMNNAGENRKYLSVNLSVPKFDIASSGDLTAMLQAVGITDIFSLADADFTAITSDSPVYVTAVNQAARVIIDEDGVKAASYIEIPGAGAAAPAEDTIDFVLDRPFLFVIASYDGVPLFTGVVNEP